MVGSHETLLDGAYRLHAGEDVVRYTALAADAFPDVANRISCFGSDWAGSQFATDEARVVRGDRQILLLEPGTGQALEIPAGLEAFHNVQLSENRDAAVAYSFFQQWLASGGVAPRYDQCIGYKRPLYLGGADDVSNLEVIDFEVYWGITAQLLAQVRHLPEGTKIGSISIGD